MPRTISVGYRQSIESQFSDDVDLMFVTISHEALVEPIRLVCDTIDYHYAGELWKGIPFDIALLTDDDSPPKAQLVVQNVDMIIGQTAAAMVGAARLRLQLLCSADFNIVERPRVPMAGVTPSIEYDANALFLSNVQCDAMQLTGDITGWDYLQRSWPGKRARKTLLPGLFR